MFSCSQSDSYKCFHVAKAKRQLQSAQPEWKLTLRYGEESLGEQLANVIEILTRNIIVFL
jgi:hypothetical protein